MPPSAWVNDDNAALFTDLYQLTMLQAYHQEGMADTAVFDLFVRRLGDRNFLVACGLETVIHYLESLRFTGESLRYLDSLDQFDSAFLAYLEEFRFTGDVFAVREGTPVFEDEPILEVVAPIGEAQLVETFLLNQITFQTNAATKALRVKQAAGDRVIADFGMRRMQGADAAMRAARAFYIAGLDSTSNVLAGQVYGIPVTGTMAHSYIEAHDEEIDAFEAFTDIYTATILLVDTYDTLDGVRKLVDLARRSGNAGRVRGIRLDSGDLGELAAASRHILDEGDLQHVSIFASGSLDEHRIEELVESGAPIDGFGVGTRMGTIADQPYLDSVYKLSEYAGTPRMKLSSKKSNLPGRKQLFRRFEEGEAVGDIIGRHDEETPSGGTPLLEQVMQAGRRTDAGQVELDEVRRHARDSVARLPERIRRLPKASEPYEVRLSESLEQQLKQTRERLEEKYG